MYMYVYVCMHTCLYVRICLENIKKGLSKLMLIELIEFLKTEVTLFLICVTVHHVDTRHLLLYILKVGPRVRLVSSIYNLFTAYSNYR